MSNILKYILLLCLVILVSCKASTKKNSYISSKDADSNVIGYYKLDADDTDYVPMIFLDPFDYRVSYSMRYYGYTVYQAKMNAMKRISGIEPPKKISSEPDSEIVNFYKTWAQEKGYLK